MLPKVQDEKYVPSFKGAGYLAVTWNDVIIVWNSIKLSLDLHHDGEWISKKINGDIPKFDGCESANVLGDKLWLLGGTKCVVIDEQLYQYISVFTLDLQSWTWSKVEPGGSQPMSMIPLVMGNASWEYDGKIYCFGAFSPRERFKSEEIQPSYMTYTLSYDGSAHVICYNIASNQWEWPQLWGDVPSPRANAKAVISQDNVFLLGGEEVRRVRGYGYQSSQKFNDLYLLDMKCLTWKYVLQPDGSPSQFCFSLNLISPSYAVLFGGLICRESFSERSGDCWLLDLGGVMQGGGNFWTRLKHQEQLPRLNHAAVLDPVTRRLLVLGGFGKGGQCGNECLDNNEISKMTFQAVPLKTLAVEYVARTIERGDPRLEKDQLPPNLKRLIEVNRRKELTRDHFEQQMATEVIEDDVPASPEEMSQEPRNVSPCLMIISGIMLTLLLLKVRPYFMQKITN